MVAGLPLDPGSTRGAYKNNIEVQIYVNTRTRLEH